MPICNKNEFLNQVMNNEDILMSLDIGTKHTGIAFSDPKKKFSLASQIIQKNKSSIFFEDILKLVFDYSVCGILVGLPLNYDGSENKKCQSIKDIIKNLDFIFTNNNIKLPIIFWDESFSTEKAYEEVEMLIKKRKKQKKIIDKFAAKYILQDFLDHINK